MILVLSQNKFVSAGSLKFLNYVGLQIIKLLKLTIPMYPLSILANIPAPIIFGKIIDTTCVIWREDSCGRQTSCWLYDNDRFWYILHGMMLVLMTTCVVIAAVMTYLARNVDAINHQAQFERNIPKITENEEDKEKQAIDGKVLQLGVINEGFENEVDTKGSKIIAYDTDHTKL